jgi:hypothetical protein
MPEIEYRTLEAARRKAGRTRSQFIREALEAKGTSGKDVDFGEINEDRQPYGSPVPSEIKDAAELRRRAIAAAGRFDSGVSDLSLDHDKYLTDPEADDRAEARRPGRTAKDGEKR